MFIIHKIISYFNFNFFLLLILFYRSEFIRIFPHNELCRKIYAAIERKKSVNAVAVNEEKLHKQ